MSFNNNPNNIFSINNNNNDSSQERARSLLVFNTDNDQTKNPRNIDFCPFTKSFCCPTFEFISFTFFIILTYYIIYGITISFGVDQNPNVLLGVKQYVLEDFGYKDGYHIQHGQIWRFLTYSVLSSDFTQLITNSFIFVIFGSIVERLLGKLKNLLLYVVVVCLINPSSVGVGSSVATFGYFGALLAFHLQNWNALDAVYQSPTQKLMNIFFIALIVILNLMMGFNSHYVDRMAFLGAFIFGFLFLYIINEPIQNNDGVCCSNNIWYWICMITFIVLYVLSFCLFYFVINTKETIVADGDKQALN